MDEQRDASQLAQITSEINAAWVAGDIERATDHFHPRVVVVARGAAQRVEGRDACLQSYRDFTAHAVVHELTTGDPHIDLFGETAIVITPFRIDYEMNGVRSVERGRDVFVFARAGGRWVAVWRTLFADPAASPPPSA